MMCECRGTMMKRMLNGKANGGYSLGFAVPMAMLLLFSSLAYLKWQVYSQETAQHQVAVTQAYYVAQAAVISKPLAFMRNQRPGFNPTADIPFADGDIPGMGKYLRPLISYVTQAGFQEGQLYQRRDYVLSATGIVDYKNFKGQTVEVRRRSQMLVRKKEFSQFFYFTDQEQTRFNEFIWFFSGDSVYSPVHSNSDIGVHPGAYFGSLVTTAGRIFSPQGSTFAGRPAPGYFEHVKPIPIPVKADLLRSSAATGGNWLNTSNQQYVYGLWFHGNQATEWRWRTGTPNPPYLDMNHTEGELAWGTSGEHAIFCDGELWISGSMHGHVGVGASGNLRLYDNITYSEGAAALYPYHVTLLMDDMATLISEAAEPGQRREDPWTGILIANTPANGREGGRDAAPAGLNGQYRRDIAIHGQLFALNSSFTFEQQNDTWDPYQAPQNLTNDERGYIYLTGAVCQHRRGYVHRSNHGGTGYLKSYQFDPRWDKTKTSLVQYPPFQVDLTSEGFMKWDVLGWQDLPRHAGDERSE